MAYPNNRLRNAPPMMRTTELPPVPGPGPIGGPSGTLGAVRDTNIAPLPPGPAAVQAPSAGSTSSGGPVQTVGTTAVDLNLTPNSGNGAPVIVPPNTDFSSHFPHIDFSGMPNPQGFQGDWHGFVDALRTWSQSQGGNRGEHRAEWENRQFRNGIGGAISAPGAFSTNGG